MSIFPIVCGPSADALIFSPFIAFFAIIILLLIGICAYQFAVYLVNCIYGQKNVNSQAEFLHFKDRANAISIFKGDWEPGHYHEYPKSYEDAVVLIKGSDIFWKVKKSKEEREAYISKLYDSCKDDIAEYARMKKLRDKIVEIIGNNSSYADNKLNLCIDDDNTFAVTAFIGGEKVFHKANFDDPTSVLAYRPGKWEKRVDELYEEAKKAEEESKRQQKIAKKLKEDQAEKEHQKNFSPIDDSKYF